MREAIEILNSFVKDEAIMLAVPLSIRVAMLSGPVALDVSKFCKNHITSSMLENKDSSSSETGA